MVGQNILKSGNLDVKQPTSSFLPRGFRFQPWKTSTVELIETDGGSPELRIYNAKDNSLREQYTLDDINDVTMCGSKTHPNAFEVISGNKPLVIMAGSSEAESRDWIWALRKLFWPDVLSEPDEGSRKLQLVSNEDSDRLKMPSGVYDVTVSLASIDLQLLFKCSSEDSRQTPVEPFAGAVTKESLSVPLTTIGKLKIEKQRNTTCLVIETSKDSSVGSVSLVFKKAEEDSCDIESVMDVLKSAIFRATDNLHECIASTKWRLAES